jgi:hypothetical protein
MAKEMTVKEIRARSIEIHKSTRDIAKQVHEHLLTIMGHIVAHKDTTVATHFYMLLAEVSKSDGKSYSVIRASAVKEWLETYAFCRFGKQKNGQPGFLLANKAYDAFFGDDGKLIIAEYAKHVASAKGNPWHKIKADETFKPFDLMVQLASLVKRAETKAKEDRKGPNGETDSIPADILAALAELTKKAA